jgi:flagellar FliL protein
MAKEAKSGTVAVDAAPPRKSGKVLIIVGALLFVILAIGAAGAFFLLKGHGNEDAEEEEVVEPVKPRKKAVKDAQPVYVTLEVFTVNLIPEAMEQFVQVTLSVEVSENSVVDQIKAYTPKIRNGVVLLLSGKKATELLTREGKERLAVEIRDQMNLILDPRARGDDTPVKEVLFTSFIIQ